jgi:hypothetical protein
MANLEHVRLVREGRKAIAHWRGLHPDERLDLSGANLLSTNLLGANLTNADLSNADLSGANLYEADLSGANLLAANLAEANLSKAHLSGANLYGANFTGAVCGSTTLINCNLEQCQGLTSVVHKSPSNIDIDTLINSKGDIPKVFLIGAAVPKSILNALEPRQNGENQYYRCFMSYSSIDEEFAARLHKDLEATGMPCWIYDQDMVTGRKVWAKIGRPIKDDDKMLTICSQISLERDGVPREIERALQKEAFLKATNIRRKKQAETRGQTPDLLNEDVLFPIRLDDYMLNEWQHEQKVDVLATHVLDFSEWRNEAKYQSALRQLLYDINPKTRWPR